ncbi:hypothetical protein KKG05_09780 [bacterium]|nr:hypothetical protein [bacterium]
MALSQEFTNAITAEVEEQIKRVSEKYDKQMEKASTKLEKEMKRRFVNAAIAVLSVVVLAMTMYLYTAARDVNSQVIELQDRILATQEKIRTATADFESAKDQLNQKKDKLMNAMEFAIRKLDSTQTLYEERLQTLNTP